MTTRIPIHMQNTISSIATHFSARALRMYRNSVFTTASISIGAERRSIRNPRLGEIDITYSSSRSTSPADMAASQKST